MKKFTYAYLRQFGLGRLLYTPRRLGKMRVGDFLDAMTGYNAGENDRIKAQAEIVRKSTWFLWNIQVDPEKRAESPQELWPFEWDKVTETQTIEPEERKKIEDCHENVLKNM